MSGNCRVNFVYDFSSMRGSEESDRMLRLLLNSRSTFKTTPYCGEVERGGHTEVPYIEITRECGKAKYTARDVFSGQESKRVLTDLIEDLATARREQAGVVPETRILFIREPEGANVN